MKKSKMIVLLLSLFFLCMGVVEAKNYLKYDWSLRQGGASNYLYYDHTIKTEDGYITASMDEEFAGMLRKISLDGKTIMWENENVDGVYMGIDQDDEYVYAVMLPTSEDTCYTEGCYSDDYGYRESFILNRYIYKFSKEDGKLVAKEVLSSEDPDINDVEIYVKDKVYVIARSYDETNEVFKATKLYTVTKDLKSITYQDYDRVPETTKEELVGGYKTLIDDSIYDYIDLPGGFGKDWCEIDGSVVFCEYDDEEEEMYYYGDLFISNTYWTKDYTYAVGETYFEIYNYNDYYDDYELQEQYSFILKINNETNKVEWLKKSLDNYHYFDIDGVNDDYMVVVGYTDDEDTYVSFERDEDSVESMLFVFDTEGNIVEKHDLAKEAGVSRVDITHIMAFGNTIVGQAFAYGQSGHMSSLVFKYDGSFSIGTNVEGNGTVNVQEDAFPGDEVEVEVKPDLGWIVDQLVVKDAAGNEIEVKDGKFIMPEGEVTIEVTFKKIVEAVIENPNTAAMSVTGLAAMAGGLGLIVKNSYKKLKFLK